MKVKDRTALARLALGTGARIDLDDGTAINAGRTRTKLEAPPAQPPEPAAAPAEPPGPSDADRLAAAVIEAVRAALAASGGAAPVAWDMEVVRGKDMLIERVRLTPVTALRTLN